MLRDDPAARQGRHERGCQVNCEYSDYLFESQYLKCKCNVVEQKQFEMKEQEKLTPKSLGKTFIDTLKYSNYKVLKCNKLVFIKSFYKNIGGLLSIFYFIGFLGSFIYFCRERIHYLKKEIQQIIENKEHKLKNKNNNIVVFNENNILQKSNNIRNSKLYKKINKTETGSKSIAFDNKSQKKKSLDIRKSKCINNPNNSKINLPLKKQIHSSKNIIPKKSNENENHNILGKKVNNKNKLHNNQRKVDFNTKGDKMQESKGILINKRLNSCSQTLENVIYKNGHETSGKSLKKINLSDKKIQSQKQSDDNYDDYELNELDYFQALEQDNRKFFRIYWSLLKREHLIIFTFFSWNDYNIFAIKLSKFFYSICTDMALNMFFFSDESMHNVYESGGIYNFFEQLFQMVISVIISQLLQIFLNYLTMTDIVYYKIKNLKKDKIIGKENVSPIINCAKYKLIIFYIFSLILFLFYWYVVSAFCAVYVNTQSIFIIDSIFSFLIELIYPFAIYFIPAGLRVLALSAINKKNLKCIYFLSNIIPFF